jgi:cell division protein FtsQ
VVEITQRTPVVRVQDRDHKDYYLDAEGHVIPTVRTYTPHILLANGNINGKYRKMQNVLSGEDKNSQDMKGLLDIARYIGNDSFWESQIVQVYLNEEGEYELIPRVGAHIIHFGGSNDVENKFFKLRTLYDEGLRHKGWNQYEFINLKYDRQVICTKR